MILIGQYDSPFVRRVGIALHLYGHAWDHRPWSVFADADLLRAVNPLGRVPTLITDDGAVLPESASILDHLDQQAETPLIPRFGPARLQAQRRIGLATGLCDKAVSLLYERTFHDHPSASWIARCEVQVGAVLHVLEQERAATASPFWQGDAPGHDDIALACAASFLAAAHPGLLGASPAILAHAALCEALPAFRAVRQDFRPPA